MKIIIEIKTCYDCQYVSHTGAYTEGGAKPCCDHPETVKSRGSDCFKRVIPYRQMPRNYANTTYRKAKKIPDWCPLRKYELKEVTK